MKHDGKTYYLYGKHSIESALSNKKRKIYEILCTKENLDYIKKISGTNKINIVNKEQIKVLFPEHTITQNIAAKVLPIVLYHIPEEILANANSKIVVLDKITDPQNLGAILRSAAAFGIDAVIYPKDGGVKENATVAKASCGALDIVPLIEVVNISQTLLDLKKHGFWAIGLCGSAKQSINDNSEIFKGKIVIVMGSEGEGIRPLIMKNCDLLVKIPISKQMESLNVSNAAAIMFYMITCQ